MIKFVQVKMKGEFTEADRANKNDFKKESLDQTLTITFYISRPLSCPAFMAIRGSGTNVTACIWVLQDRAATE